MQEFWRILSLLLCLTVFAVVGGLLLVTGESFPDSILRAAISFAVLYVVLNAFGTILNAVIGSSTQESQKSKPAAEESDTQQI